MINNKLLGDWRLRVINANAELFEVATRIHFVDSNTSLDKEVFASIDDSVTLGAYVDLDSQGYVPVSGIWLGTGGYSAIVEYYITTDQLGVEEWGVLYTIPYISGSDGATSSITGDVANYDTIIDLLAVETIVDSNIMVNGYLEVGDEGGGKFYWNTFSTAIADGGSVFIPNHLESEQPGRYIRLFDDVPNIKQFGAVTTATNCSTNIALAQSYTNANNTKLKFLPGVYQLQTADLTIYGNNQVENNCTFTTTGTITVNDCDYKVEGMIADNVTYLGFNYVKPEWYGAKGDNTSNDIQAFYDAYTEAETIGAGIILENQYILEGLQSFNTNELVGTIFEINSKVTVNGLTQNICFGDITTLGWNGDNCLDIYDNTYLMPSGKMYQRWFTNFTAYDYETLLNSGSYTITFVWTSKITWDNTFTEVALVSHVFEDNASWQLTTACQFNKTEFDFRYIFDIASLEYLTGFITIVNTGLDNISLSADLSLTLSDYFTFQSCVFDITGDKTLTFGYGKLIDCRFQSGTSITINSISDTKMINCQSVITTKFTGNNITGNTNLFNAVQLVGSSVIASLKTMNFQNNNFRDTVTLVSNYLNTVVTEIEISNNIFSLELSTTRILKSGSFSNVDGAHRFLIENNKAKSREEQTYVPMTKGQYYWRSNEGSADLLLTPSDYIFNADLFIVDDLKYNGLTILKRQVFALNDLSDDNKFDELYFTNVVGKYWNVDGTLHSQNDFNIECKASIIGEVLTNYKIYVNRAPVNDGTTLITNWFSGILNFSMYNSEFNDDGLTPYLP